MKTISVQGWLLERVGPVVYCAKPGRGEFWIDGNGRQTDRTGVPYAGPIPCPPQVRAEAMRLLGMFADSAGVQ